MITRRQLMTGTAALVSAAAVPPVPPFAVAKPASGAEIPDDRLCDLYSEWREVTDEYLARLAEIADA